MWTKGAVHIISGVDGIWQGIAVPLQTPLHYRTEWGCHYLHLFFAYGVGETDPAGMERDAAVGIGAGCAVFEVTFYDTSYC